MNLSHFRTLLSVTNLNLFALRGNGQNRIKCKCANDYEAPGQWWHACLGLPTPALKHTSQRMDRRGWLNITLYCVVVKRCALSFNLR